LNTYEKTFENIEQLMIEGLELMVRSLQVQYKNALSSIFDQRRGTYQGNKKSENVNGLKTNITTKENQSKQNETFNPEKPKKVA
jgi:hypothetical protein